MLFGPGKTNNFEYSNNVYFQAPKQNNQKSNCMFNNSFTMGQKCASHEKISRNGDQRFFNFQQQPYLVKPEQPLTFEEERFKQTVVFKSPTHVQFSKFNFPRQNNANMPLQHQCLILRKQKSQLSEKMKRAEQQLQTKQNMIKGKQKEIEQLKLINSQSCSTKSQSQVLSDLRSEKQKLYFQVIQLQTEIHKMQQKYEKIQREHYGLSQKYDELTNKSTLEMSRKISKQQLLQSQLSLSQKRNQRIKTQYQKQISSLKQKIRDLQSSCSQSTKLANNRSTVLSYNQSFFTDSIYTPMKSQPDLETSPAPKFEHAQRQKLQNQLKQKTEMIKYLEMQCLKDKRRENQSQANKNNHFYEESKKQLNKAIKDNQSLKKQNGLLQGKIASSDKMREELIKQVKDLEYLLKEVRDKLCKTMEENRAINKRQRDNNQKLNDKIHQLEAQLSKCSAKFRQELEQTQKAYEKALNQTKQRNGIQLISKEQQVKQYSIQKQQLLLKITEYQKLLKQSSQNSSQFEQLRLKMKQSQQYRTKLQLKSAQQFQQKVHSLQKSISQKCQQVQSHTHTITTLQHKLHTQQQTITTLEQDKQVLERTNKKLQEQINAVWKQKETIKKQDQELQRSAKDQEYESRIGVLEARMAKEVDRYEGVVKYLRDEEDKLRNMIADRERDNLNLTISYENQKQKYNQSTQKLKWLKQQKKQLKKQLQSLKQHQNQLKVSLSASQTQLCQLTASSSQLQFLSQKASQQQQKILQLEQQRVENVKKIEQLEDLVIKYEAKIAELDTLNRQYEENIRLYQLELITFNEIKAGISRRDLEISKKDMEIVSLRQVNQKYEGAKSMMKIQVDKIDGMLSQKQKQIESKCQQIQKLQQQVQNQTKQVQSQTKQIQSLSEQVQILSQQISIVTVEASSLKQSHMKQVFQLQNSQISKLSILQQQLAQQKLVSTRLNSQLTKNQQQLAKTKQELNQFQLNNGQEISNLSALVQSLKKQVQKGKIINQGLETQLFETEGLLAQTSAKLEFTNKLNDQAKSNNQQLIKNNQQLVRNAQTMETMIVELQQKIKRIQQQSQLKTQESTEQSHRIQQLSTQLSQKQKQLSSLATTHRKSVETVELQQKTISELQQALKQKQQQLDQTLKDYCLQLQKCKTQLLENQCTIQQLKLKLQNYQSQQQQNRKSLEEKDRYNREIEEEIEELTRELEDIKDKFRQVQMHNSNNNRQTNGDAGVVNSFQIITKSMEDIQICKEEEPRMLKRSKMSGLSSQSFIGDFIQIDKNALLHICDLLGLEAVDGCLLSSIIQTIQHSNYLTINQYYRQILQLFGVQQSQIQKMQQKLINQIKSFRETMLNLVQKVSMLQSRVQNLSKQNHRLIKQLNKLEYKEIKLFNLENILEGANQNVIRCRIAKLNQKYEVKEETSE